jgi:transposase
MLKAFRYKLEPNKSQRYALARALDVCRELYNDGLYQRKLHPISRYEDHNAAVNILARNEPLDANVSGVTPCVV